MNRKEQIEYAAMDLYGKDYDGCVEDKHAFKKGAEWADANPNLNDFGKETLILQATYKKIEELETERQKLKLQLGIARTALADIVEDGGYGESDQAATALVKISELNK